MGAGCLRSGWIYALRSDNSSSIKIGRTSTTPFQRLRELNAHEVYGPLGPWQHLHLKQVRDTIAVETALHRKLSAFRSQAFGSARELFDISPQRARLELDAIPQADLTAPVPLNKLQLDPPFLHYLRSLFEYAGLENFKEIQEAWIFSLFPKTAGGRFFTLNIDRHEVAYSAPIVGEPDLVHHIIVVDRLAKRDRELKRWLKQNFGWFERIPYPSNWGDAIVVCFQAPFDDSLGIFELSGFRRALIAYWFDALLRMQERGTRSLHAKRHNYDATSEIFRHLAEMRAFRSVKAAQ